MQDSCYYKIYGWVSLENVTSVVLRDVSSRILSSREFFFSASFLPPTPPPTWYFTRSCLSSFKFHWILSLLQGTENSKKLSARDFCILCLNTKYRENDISQFWHKYMSWVGEGWVLWWHADHYMMKKNLENA